MRPYITTGKMIHCRWLSMHILDTPLGQLGSSDMGDHDSVSFEGSVGVRNGIIVMHMFWMTPRTIIQQINDILKRGRGGFPLEQTRKSVSNITASPADMMAAWAHCGDVACISGYIYLYSMCMNICFVGCELY